MRLPLVPAVLTVCALATGACGGEDGPNAKRFDGEQKDVAAVIDDLQSASRADEPERICDEIFSKGLRETIRNETGVPCDERVSRQLVDEKATYKVNGVRLDGKRRAVVNVVDGRGSASVLYVVKSDDDWRIDRIAR